jgi:hypothetical protein
VACAALKGVGLYDEVQEARAQIGAYEELADELVGDFLDGERDLRLLLAGLAEVLLEFLRVYRASRFLRWALRRLLLLGGLISAVEAILQALVLLESADKVVRALGDQLESISCLEDV